MTRAEYNEYRYIKSSAKKYGLPPFGSMYTIAVSASPDYKMRLHNLYESWDLHPASVRVDTHYFDDKERIIYIKGRIWKDDNGKDHSWAELYTSEEKQRFDAKLHQ